VRHIRRDTRGVDPGKVAVCAGRVRENAVSRTTDAVRQAVAKVAVSSDDIGTGHRATVLCPARRQDAHRDAHPRHAAQWRLLQLAVHVRTVAEQLGADCTVATRHSQAINSHISVFELSTACGE